MTDKLKLEISHPPFDCKHHWPLEKAVHVDDGSKASSEGCTLALTPFNYWA